MKSLKLLLYALVCMPLAAFPFHSREWGFTLDLPEGYQLRDETGNYISFVSSIGTSLDIFMYEDKESVEALAEETARKLGARAERQSFTYNGKKAALALLRFPLQARGAQSGWALFVEAANDARASGMIAVLAYGPETAPDLLHLSALDSLAVSEEDRLFPGPVTEFTYPPEDRKLYPLAGTEQKAWFRENDAEAAQSLIDREFAVLALYAGSPFWEEAWKRFYRAVYRDSFERLKNAAFLLERRWQGILGNRDEEARAFAEKALEWVQGFIYERDLSGSDFVNLVSAVQEGRGDCDSRAMLWAVVLEQAGIPSAIMVSQEFGHAMGLADLAGEGARFPFTEGNRPYNWMVAETTARVGIGRIAEDFSEISKWLGILFF